MVQRPSGEREDLSLESGGLALLTASHPDRPDTRSDPSGPKHRPLKSLAPVRKLQKPSIMRMESRVPASMRSRLLRA